MGKITGEVSEKISGMKVLQSFTQKEIAGSVVDEKLESHYMETIKMAKFQALFSAFIQFLPELAKFSVIVIGIVLITRSQMKIGDITGLILILSQLFFPLKRSADTTIHIGSSIGALDRVFDFFDAQPTVKETDNPIKIDKINGRIEFRNVSFGYPEKEASYI